MIEEWSLRRLGRGPTPRHFKLGSRSGGQSLECTVTRINPDNWKGVKYCFRVNWARIDAKVLVPEATNLVPSWGQNATADVEGPDRYDIWRSSIPDDLGPDEDKRAGLERAERFARLVCQEWLIRSPVRTQMENTAFFNTILAKHRSKEIYDGWSLCFNPRMQLNRTIRPSESMVRSVDGKMPSICIRSLDMAWAVPVLDAGRWCSSCVTLLGHDAAQFQFFMHPRKSVVIRDFPHLLTNRIQRNNIQESTWLLINKSIHKKHILLCQ